MTAPKNPKPLGLPITISASQALANLEVSRAMDSERAARRAGTKVVMNALKPAETSPFGRTPADRGPNKAQRDAQAVHDSYMVGDTTPSKVDLPTSGCLRLTSWWVAPKAQCLATRPMHQRPHRLPSRLCHSAQGRCAVRASIRRPALRRGRRRARQLPLPPMPRALGQLQVLLPGSPQPRRPCLPLWRRQTL